MAGKWWEVDYNLDFYVIKRIQEISSEVNGIVTAPVKYPKNLNAAHMPMTIVWPGPLVTFPTAVESREITLTYEIEVVIEPIAQGFTNLSVTRQKQQVLRTQFMEIFSQNKLTYDFVREDGFVADIDATRETTFTGMLPSLTAGDALRYGAGEHFGFRITLPVSSSGRIC